MASKIAIVLGTRPEIIKMSPIIRGCQQSGTDFFILHTGQHYSYAMDKVFFEQLELPAPRYNLDVGSGPHGAQTAKMMAGMEPIFISEQPDIVLVQGDTNTVLAGAMVASKLHLKVGHVEAGLRSYDRDMPEEINRVIADHVSDYLFAPTEKSAGILRGEGIPEERIRLTGNTIVDAVLQNRDLAARRSGILQEFGLRPGGYILMTAHRQENVDDARRFQGILDGARAVSRDLGMEVVYPIHPRSAKMLKTLSLDASGIRLIDPVDFLGFLQIEANARIILTDSGGVQEEACILGVPCVTLRDNTERPETCDVGANVLAGADAVRIRQAAHVMATAARSWSNPFGDGTASASILAVCRQVRSAADPARRVEIQKREPASAPAPTLPVKNAER